MDQVVLSQLNIYPIKSAGGISLQSAEVEARGLRHDRRWMVVDIENRFLTQREFPKLALVKVQLTDNGLLIDATGMSALKIPNVADVTSKIRVMVWEDSVQAVDVGKEAEEWFCEFLGAPCRLVYMPEDADRQASRETAVSQVSFADAYPLLVISEESLEDLNSRLAVPVPMNRFRPNIVVKGCESFAEDTWKEIRIGSVQFQVVKPCARCMITTVDQTTGVKGKEPLRTLASYRGQNGSVLFGQNLIQGNTGNICVGDTINVLETKTHQTYIHSKESTS